MFGQLPARFKDQDRGGNWEVTASHPEKRDIIQKEGSDVKNRKQFGYVDPECVGYPNPVQILQLLRELLENEEVALVTIREYYKRKDDLECQEYVWTVACTL